MVQEGMLLMIRRGMLKPHNNDTVDVGAHRSLKRPPRACKHVQTQGEWVWYKGKVLPIALVLLVQFSSQRERKTRSC